MLFHYMLFPPLFPRGLSDSAWFPASSVVAQSPEHRITLAVSDFGESRFGRLAAETLSANLKSASLKSPSELSIIDREQTRAATRGAGVFRFAKHVAPGGSHPGGSHWLRFLCDWRRTNDSAGLPRAVPSTLRRTLRSFSRVDSPQNGKVDHVAATKFSGGKFRSIREANCSPTCPTAKLAGITLLLFARHRITNDSGVNWRLTPAHPLLQKLRTTNIPRRVTRTAAAAALSPLATGLH